MNNFEKIKAINIDEMAEFLNYSKCKMCAYIKSHDNLPLCTGNYECLNGISQWLESEVRE